MQVNDGGNLTAYHIFQSALIIGGAAGNPAVVTIAASDNQGNPLGVSADAFSAIASSASPIAGDFTAISSAPSSIGGNLSATSGSAGSGAAPEPSTFVTALVALCAVAIIRLCRRGRLA
ncbi:MAG TPA: hypothetical protein VGH32_08125 [Pirellulales bacterium]